MYRSSDFLEWLLQSSASLKERYVVLGEENDALNKYK